MITGQTFTEVYYTSLEYLVKNMQSPLDSDILGELPICIEIDHFSKASMDITDDFIDNIYDGAREQLQHEFSFYKDELGNRIEDIVNTIRENPASRKLYFNFWSNEDTQVSSKSPCLTALYFRLMANGKLNMTIFMRANNAFKISFMNFMIFGDFFIDICERLDLGLGKYIHMATSYHIYKQDVPLINTSQILKGQKIFI